jgi:toxin-antitoxin system PIN domain toxin
VSTLLDANVLIALIWVSHVHHAAAEAWLGNGRDEFITCPITQGSLVRFLVRQGSTPEAAKAFLAEVTDHPRHVFWPDSIGYENVVMGAVLGHTQVTDAYLAQLARTNRGRLATFDRGLAGLHGDVVDLIPPG